MEGKGGWVCLEAVLGWGGTLDHKGNCPSAYLWSDLLYQDTEGRIAGELGCDLWACKCYYWFFADFLMEAEFLYLWKQRKAWLMVADDLRLWFRAEIEIVKPLTEWHCFEVKDASSLMLQASKWLKCPISANDIRAKLPDTCMGRLIFKASSHACTFYFILACLQGSWIITSDPVAPKTGEMRAKSAMDAMDSSSDGMLRSGGVEYRFEMDPHPRRCMSYRTIVTSWVALAQIPFVSNSSESNELLEIRLSIEELLSVGLRGEEDQLNAKHQLAVKGLSECKALESNIRRI
ncbi:hypothetical protein Tco_1437442 [Tanacetum coccineum]